MLENSSVVVLGSELLDTLSRCRGSCDVGISEEIEVNGMWIVNTSFKGTILTYDCIF